MEGNQRKNVRAAAGESRARILTAAKALLWRVGYEAMSPKRLLAESGVGQGSLYHHFRGKKAVAAAALEAVAEDLGADLRALADPDTPPAEAIHRWLATPRRGAAGCRLGRLVNETAFDDFTLRAPIERYFADLEAALAARIAEAQARGELGPSPAPAALAAMLMTVVQGGFVLSRARRDDAPLAQATEACWALLQSAARAAGGPKEGEVA